MPRSSSNLKPVDLGKEEFADKAKAKFFDQLKRLKNDGVLDDDVELAGDEFFETLAENLDVEAGVNEKKILFIKKREGVNYIVFDDVEVGYFKDNKVERERLGNFLASLLKAKEELEQEEINQFIQEEMEGITHQDEINELKDNIMSDIESGSSHVDDALVFKAKENDVEWSNDNLELKLKEKADYLSEVTETLLLKYQDTHMQMQFEIMKDRFDELSKLSEKLRKSSVDSNTRSERYEIKADIVFTVCEIKHYLDTFKVSGGFWTKERTANLDKELSTILEGVGFDERGGFLGFGKEVWKDKNIKATLEYIDALHTINTPGTSIDDYNDAVEVINEYQATYPDFKYTGKAPNRTGSGAAIQGGGVYAGVSNRLAKIDKNGQPINPSKRPRQKKAINTNKQGVDNTSGSSKQQLAAANYPSKTADDYAQVDGIDITINNDGQVVVERDLTKLPPTVLVDQYFATAENLSTNSPRHTEKNKHFNYALAIMQEVIEHPENKNLIIERLGQGSPRSGQAEMRKIMETVIFDGKFKEKLRALYWRLKKNRDHEQYPPEWDLYKPDKRENSDDLLLEIAFGRLVPKKYKMLSGDFEAYTDGDKNQVVPDNLQVFHFIHSMGVPEISTFVREAVGDEFDLEREPTTAESWEAAGMTGSGGVYDKWVYNACDKIDNTDRSPKTKEFLKNTTKVLGKGAKILHKGAELFALGAGIWKGVQTLWGGVQAIIKGDASHFTKPLTGLFGAGAAYFGLKIADNAPGMQGVVTAGKDFMGLDTPEDNATEHINAVELDYETYNISSGVEATIGALTMQEIMNRNLIFADGKNTYVNVENLTADEMEEYLPLSQNRDKPHQLDKLRDSMGEYLRQNYGVDQETLSEWSTKYPNITLNQLIDRLSARPKLSALFGNVIPNSLMSKDDYLELRALPDNLYEKKKEQLAFVAQQFNKFKGHRFEQFTNAHSSLSMPSNVDPILYIGLLLDTEDGTGQKLSTWAQEHFKKILDAEPTDDISPLIEQYFKALYAASWNEELLVADGQGNNVSLWTTGPNGLATGVGEYFHNPTIGNGRKIAPYVKNPTLGANGKNVTTTYTGVKKPQNFTGTDTWGTL